MPMPPVSVFMTVRNEEAHLEECVASVLAQRYDGPVELVVAVGPSEDRTHEIATRLAATHEALVVVDNPPGLTPHGLNRAVAAASHDLLVRTDGHAELPPDYLHRVVTALLETGAANVGGRMHPEGGAPVGRAIAHAMSSRFGIGGAAFHVGAPAGPQPTVYLGAFRRDALERVGGYDEYFVRAQDWELNHRLRAAGETVWFDPTIAVTYRPRDTWRAFARQQFRTGAWRRRVVRRYPETASVRYLAPPAVAAATVLGLLLAALAPLTSAWLLLALLLPVGYLVGVSVVALVDGRDLEPRVRLRLPLAFAVLHLSWGTGFLVGRG